MTALLVITLLGLGYFAGSITITLAGLFLAEKAEKRQELRLLVLDYALANGLTQAEAHRLIQDHRL